MANFGLKISTGLAGGGVLTRGAHLGFAGLADVEVGTLPFSSRSSSPGGASMGLELRRIDGTRPFSSRSSRPGGGSVGLEPWCTSGGIGGGAFGPAPAALSALMISSDSGSSSGVPLPTVGMIVS